MTLEKLNEICKKNNIPENVKLMSDSGWECCETDMDGLYYSRKMNTLVITPTSEFDEKYIGKGWSKNFIPEGEIFERVS